MTVVTQVIDAVPASEGAGVRIYRALGVNALPSLDPFLMLDFFGSNNPDDYVAGFPDHPHRGFITITYMLAGRMRHKDSMGNEGVLEAGDVQWMKAASGVIHSEMPEQQDGLMRGFQLWLNLPASEKMSDPEYRDINGSEIPLIDAPWGQLRLLAGDVGDVTGAIKDTHTGLFYADLMLQSGHEYHLDAFSHRNGFVFVYEGEMQVAGMRVRERQLAVIDGNPVRLFAADGDSRAIIVSGKALNERVSKYGPFVMTTEDQIRQAINDYQQGKLVRKRATGEA